MKSIESAGGLVISPDYKVLFIFKKGRWDLPKGRVEKKQSIEECALREVHEEAGLKSKHLSIRHVLIPTHHVTRHSGVNYDKTTHWFVMDYDGDPDIVKPQIEEGIYAVKWFSFWELEEPLSNCPTRIKYLVDFWQKCYAYPPKA